MSWEDNVRKVVPYVPGEQPKDKNVIKLNTNECPYAPSPMVLSAIKAYDGTDLRKYPDTDATALVDELAKTYHLNKEQIFVGIGSDDVLSLAFLTFFNSKKPILFPDITYSFYDVWADLYLGSLICSKLVACFSNSFISLMVFLIFSSFSNISSIFLYSLYKLEFSMELYNFSKLLSIYFTC